MHSVVVLGDVRTHKCKVAADLWKQQGSAGSPHIEEDIAEGAYFIERAIGQIVDPLCAELERRWKEAETKLGLADKAVADTIAAVKSKSDELTDHEARLTALLQSGKVDSKDADWLKGATETSIAHTRSVLGQAERAADFAKQQRKDAQLCVKQLESAKSSKLRVFGLTAPDKYASPLLTGYVRHWNMKLVHMEDGTKHVGRQQLDRSEAPAAHKIPLISEGLLDALSPRSTTKNRVYGDLDRGIFEVEDKVGNPYQYATCPDIVVFEDRGQSMIRELRFPDDVPWSDAKAHELVNEVFEELKSNTSGDLSSFFEALNLRMADCALFRYFEGELKKGAELLEKDKKEGKALLVPPEDMQHSICHRLLLQWAIVNLLERMTVPERKSRDDHRPAMEPVIICSILENVQKAVEKKDVDKEPNLYDLLLASEWLRDRTIVLLDAEDLRQGEPALGISSGLSWERTVQETIVELKRSRGHAKLLEFGQVIVRYGVTGALHIARRADGQHSFTLYFDVRYDDATWSDENSNTSVFGRAAVFIASLIQSLTLTCNERHGHPFIQELLGGVSRAMNGAIGRSQQLARSSYGHSYEEFNKLKGNGWLPEGLFEVPTPRDKNKRPDPSSAVFNKSDVPAVILRDWSILGQNAQAHLGNLASLIVRNGPEVIINGHALTEFPATAAPVTRYDKSGSYTYVVDRREVEEYRAIEKVIRSHVERARLSAPVPRGGKPAAFSRRPVSFAVFGPPGSGKTTAVNRIIEKLQREFGTGSLEPLPPFNLSQYAGVEELKSAFVSIGNVEDKIPVAFFDEFDGNFPEDTEPLGWLKYFLSPMEDGFFKGTPLGSAILVFAGGTAGTFADFSLEGRARTDEQWLKFSQAKGPDFVSRLSGHLNIIGINPADPGDELYLIRRAIFIHSILKSLQSLGDGEQARIDEAMVRAVLHIPEYRHGGRSLRMLLESCQDHAGKISVSAVPPMHQLNMLVDGKAFAALLTNLSAA